LAAATKPTRFFKERDMRLGETIRVVIPVFLVVLATGLWQSATAQDAQREQTVDRLNRQLGRLKPHGTFQKDANDFFVVGTAELTKVSGHADVCFQVKRGQRETAEYLVDFIAGAPAKTLRKWHVFYRLKDEATAQDAMQFARQQYDRMQAYRDGLKRKYRATTIRRC
jgi:hypothetical protein